MVGQRGNNAVNGAVCEETPLLGGSGPGPKPSGWRRRMVADVSYSWSDVVLLICYMVTGLLDSASIQVWGAFVSMQTGNTVYIGLGIASLISNAQSTPRFLKSVTSICCFCLGSFFFARFHRLFSPRRRWVLCVSFAAQAVFTAAAAFIVSAYPPHSGDSVTWNVLLPIGLIAFQGCGQAVASRALRHNALTSVVLTSVYCDLFSDQELFALQNVTRNRRVAAPLLLLTGAVLGGGFSNSVVGIAGAMWLAAVMKLCIVITWFAWPGESEETDN